MSQLIMVIDDEAGMRDLICDALKLAGFETIEAPDAMVAQTLLRTTKPDLLIVDINMPMMDGFEFIERIRSNKDNTPALMLSARGDRADITRGLSLGADDYVTKPLRGIEELVLRVKAILRRSQFTIETQAQLECGPIALDSDSHQVTLSGVPVELSPTEFRLLHVLLESKAVCSPSPICLLKSGELPLNPKALWWIPTSPTYVRNSIKMALKALKLSEELASSYKRRRSEIISSFTH